MDGLSFELTNVCNRHCLHCLRNKADPPGFLPLTLAREVLDQAKSLGFKTVCLTGGEVALYPFLQDFLALVVDHGFTFSLVTNGHRFRENLLPILLTPKNREKLKGVCFSLDGAKSETHDALRGEGSFWEVVEAATLCELADLPFDFKSVVTNFNKKELLELALKGIDLGAQGHSFLHPFPSPRSIRDEVIPPPEELRSIFGWIANSLARALKTKIVIEGYASRTTLFRCANILQGANLDFQGNLILCCNLSHITQGDGKPSVLGQECLADLKEVSLREGLSRHFHEVAQLMEARLWELEKLSDLSSNPCYWCLRHFGKLKWLQEFPESPWAADIL